MSSHDYQEERPEVEHARIWLSMLTEQELRQVIHEIDNRRTVTSPMTVEEILEREG